MKEIFYGIKQIIKPCKYCHSSLISNDHFSTLQLHIPQLNNSKLNLYDCLNRTIHNDEMDDGIKKCDFCGLSYIITSYTKLWKTPQILILQFIRFTNNSNKITIDIEYPINNLNLSNYFNINSPYKNNCIYDLVGINIHSGIYSIYSGHYTSFIKNIFNNNWYYYNDNNPIIKINDIKQLQNNNAYILFYKLRN